MPQGQLYLRTKGTIQAAAGSDLTGLVVADAYRPAEWANAFPSGKGYGWADAFLRYGLSLEDGAMSKLLTPAPKKKGNSASEVTKNGVAYSAATLGMADEREMSFDVHFVAPDRQTFLANYDLFCAEVLSPGYVQLRFSVDNVGGGLRDRGIYHLKYDDCQQFQEFAFQMAKFTLSFTEPHPEIRDERWPAVLNQ